MNVIVENELKFALNKEKERYESYRANKMSGMWNVDKIRI